MCMGIVGGDENVNRATDIHDDTVDGSVMITVTPSENVNSFRAWLQAYNTSFVVYHHGFLKGMNMQWYILNYESNASALDIKMLLMNSTFLVEWPNWIFGLKLAMS